MREHRSRHPRLCFIAIVVVCAVAFTFTHSELYVDDGSPQRPFVPSLFLPSSGEEASQRPPASSEREPSEAELRLGHKNVPEDVKVADTELLRILHSVLGVYEPGAELAPLRHPNVAQYGENTEPNVNGTARFPFKTTRPRHEWEDLDLDDELAPAASGRRPFAEKFVNTVLMLFASSKHATFVYNWICWTRRYNLKWMIVSADEELHRNLTSMGHTSYLYPEGTTTNVRRGGATYNRFLHRKFYSIQRALTAGFDVFYSDVDVVLLNDPFRFMAGDADIEYQPEPLFFDNGISSNVEINSGFLWYKSNVRTRRLFSEITDAMKEATEPEGDQAYVNKALRSFQKEFNSPEDAPRQYPHPEGKFVTRAMNPIQFANGAIAHKTMRRQRYLDQVANGTTPVMQHFNFLKGGVNPKVACMKQYNLYLYDGLQYGAGGASGEPTGIVCHDGDAFENVDWSSKKGCDDFDIPPPPSSAPSHNPEHGT